MKYIPFDELSTAERNTVYAGFYHRTPWIPDWEYKYPVTKIGRLIRTMRRKSPSLERATELKALWEIQQILES